METSVAEKRPLLPTEEQWESARKDSVILEEKIAALVDEFEQKHKPIQVNVLTRWRDYEDKYSLSKGGPAQVCLNRSLGDRDINTVHQTYLLTPLKVIDYIKP